MLSLVAAAIVAGPSQSGPADGPSSGGLIGYISMRMPPPPDEFRYGVSFYVSAWALTEKPIAGFQIGLPSTWIVPDNRDFNQPLCPPGTIARDNWPERGPYYRDVFQTIEGGLGFWASTRFGSAVPKYRINGTPDGYNHEISSPGWGFGQTKAFDGQTMGIAQLSNRLLCPPDGLTFRAGTNGEILGNAWMALDIPSVGRRPDAAVTGKQSWTLFLNAANFKGPLAYWIPETWSRLSQSYRTIEGRGLDARPALMMGGAMEVNTVPCFEAKDSTGVTYTRVPKLLFPVDGKGRTYLMQDIEMYSQKGVLPSGAFDEKAGWTPRLTANPFGLTQGNRSTPLKGIDSTVKTAIFSESGHDAFGLQWQSVDGSFPEYFKSEGKGRVAVRAEQVPAETHLTERVFASPSARAAYTKDNNEECWQKPGPVKGPFSVKLSDGSTVTYSWYRFVDQPALQHLAMAPAEKNRLQRFVEHLHTAWKIDGRYLPSPNRGKLASLDGALIVTPPKGLEVGYVPIVTRQEILPRSR